LLTVQASSFVAFTKGNKVRINMTYIAWWTWFSWSISIILLKKHL